MTIIYTDSQMINCFVSFLKKVHILLCFGLKLWISTWYFDKLLQFSNYPEQAQLAWHGLHGNHGMHGWQWHGQLLFGGALVGAA